MALRLVGKTAMVTGGGRGIGRAISLRFAQEGAALMLAQRTLAKVEETAKEIRDAGGKAIAMAVDIRNEEQVNEMVKRTADEFGGVDILVNNAAFYGGHGHKGWDTWPYEQWKASFDINIIGGWLCAKAVAPYMKQRGKGKIVNIASNVARVGGAPFFMPYACGKGAIYTMTHALARALGKSNINVNAVAPGFTATEASLDMTGGGSSFDNATMGQSIARREEPEDLVGATLFLASSDSDFISGQVLYVDGGTVML